MCISGVTHSYVFIEGKPVSAILRGDTLRNVARMYREIVRSIGKLIVILSHLHIGSKIF